MFYWLEEEEIFPNIIASLNAQNIFLFRNVCNELNM